MTRRRATAEPPKTIEQALGRSAHHARNALAEALLAGHALIDAAAIAVTGRAASGPQEGASTAGAALATLAERVEGLAGAFRSGEAEVPEVWARAILDALDLEIGRWEQRSQEDRDARAVLRAFLGLREILWEFGLRADERRGDRAQSEGGEESAQAAPGDRELEDDEFVRHTARARRPARRRARVQHIEVDG